MTPLFVAELQAILTQPVAGVSLHEPGETFVESLGVWVDHLRDLVEDSGLPVGTVRTWKGGLVVKKMGPGKWVKMPKGRAGAKAPTVASAVPAKAVEPVAAKVASTGMGGITEEPTVASPKGVPVLNPDPMLDTDGNGISDSARVGLCGTCTAPPSRVPRLPNLTADERAAESRFADAYEADPDAVVDAYRKKLAAREVGDAPNVFATDDVKLLSPDYNPVGTTDEVMEGRGRYNTATHQVANAVAKRAFMQRLDELSKLPPEDPQRTVLITSGGVASGKGYTLGNVKEASDLVKTVGAVWDAAGEQNATENPWVKDELKKRGLKGVFVFVDSDPATRWENPKLGVVERAKKVGRMVDARLFADSYAIGAQNFDGFMKTVKDDPDMQTLVLSSRTNPPSRVDKVSPESLDLKADDIYAHASKVIDEREDLPARVRRGASTGRRIWGAPSAKTEAKGRRRPRVESKDVGRAIKKEAESVMKLMDTLLKNLTTYLADPSKADAERDARDLKARPLSLPGDKVKPPPLDANGIQKKR